MSSNIHLSNAYTIDSWAKPSYETLISKKIFPTILKNNDNYKDNINRLEFTHLIITYLMSNKFYDQNNSVSKYKDVNDEFVNLATSLGIISGYTDGNFKPHAYITRSEAAVIIYNTERKINYIKKGNVDSFKDFKFIPNWAVESVGAISSAKIMNGYPDKKFYPSKNITKQEAIVIVSNLVKSKKTTIDTFSISKNDNYMSKNEYDFALSNIPISKYKIDMVKEKIFATPKEKRTLVYSYFMKNVPYTNNELLTSPNLIFEDYRYMYLIGIERRKNNTKMEQRVFMLSISLESGALNSNSNREYSSWYIVQQ